MSNYPPYEFEPGLYDLGFTRVVGVDEVGIGPGSGPVVAAAIYIDPIDAEDFIGRVRDSKKMSEKKRVAIASELAMTCDVGVGIVNNEIVDKINIRKATMFAMKLAIHDLDIKPDFALIDGNMEVDGLTIPQAPIIKGDSKILSIAAASVVAKVIRDNIMYDLHEQFPEYMWCNNKGYLTEAHIKAIAEYGPTDYHRKTFRGVKEYVMS